MMFRKMILALGSVAFFGSIGFGLFVVGTRPVEAQAEATLTPLYAGLDSIGGRPAPQAGPPPNRPLFYFEAKAYWPQLGVVEPRTSWELVQQAMYRQDDEGTSTADEISKEIQAEQMYLRAEQIDHHLSSSGERVANVLLVHARLGLIYLKRGLQGARSSDMATRTAALADLDRAISRFGHVLVEQEFRQGQHLKRGEAYKARFEVTHAPADAFAAIREFSLEQDIAPLNMRSAFEMAEVLEEMKPQGITLAQLCAAETSSTTSPHVGALCNRVANEGADHDSEAIRSLVRYCQEGQVHSEAYPLRFLVARKLLTDIGATEAQQAECTKAYEAPVCRRDN